MAGLLKPASQKSKIRRLGNQPTDNPVAIRPHGLEQEVPERVARIIRNLRHPDARWVRIPIGLLCIVAGFFSFLPVLGLWMLPLGLLLLAYDVPFLRKPVGYFTIWSAEK